MHILQGVLFYQIFVSVSFPDFFRSTFLQHLLKTYAC